MSGKNDDSVKKEVLHGFLASALGKAIYLLVSGTLSVLVAIAYITRQESVTLPGWVISLTLVIVMTVAAASATLYLRRTFSLARRLSADAFGREVRSGQRVRILNTFIPNIAEIASDLVDALDRGAEVQVLVMHPKCEEVLYRAETLGKPLDWVENKIFETLDELHQRVNARTKNRHLMRVRVFKAWPPFALYATDRKLMVGYYWAGELAIYRPQLILSKRHESFNSFHEQFEMIWMGREVHDLELHEWRNHLDYVR